MMKKFIFAAVAVLASVFGVSAENVVYAYKLIVNQKDGTSVEFKFEEEPVATLEGDDVKITLYAADDIDNGVLFPIAQLQNFTFEKDALSGVSEVASKADVSFGLTRTALQVAGLEAGQAVDIFSADGRQVARGICDANGNATIALEALPAGVYAVKAGKSTFKFIR